ncbi:hypothetical protein P872_12860 [Rhodonellum psychrophilum GCM71 = DSM 17998]|uniref:Uncharacterized protein n=2 Tax=Rhodonellum TaxID=336827 RepID=U5BVA6_9BACT|nr:hypothetical protein P872_12860 [Rhodonellum psychrophilum GCM71 = DSM 17998]SDZ31595.1 hypothetical protein SAMN05444412_11025 [Rhodonellum ikkaensis]
MQMIGEQKDLPPEPVLQYGLQYPRIMKSDFSDALFFEVYIENIWGGKKIEEQVIPADCDLAALTRIPQEF